MNTVTVRFEAMASSQAELKEELSRGLHDLATQGLVDDFQVEAVFPGDESAKYKGTFVVHFRSREVPEFIARALEQQVNGIQSAYVPAVRAAV